VEIEGALF